MMTFARLRLAALALLACAGPALAVPQGSAPPPTPSGIGALSAANALSELSAASAAARSNIQAAKSGANSDITSITLGGATTAAAGAPSRSVTQMGAGVMNYAAVAPGTGNSQLTGYSFFTTFGSSVDAGPRRTADIWAGFNGGVWGTEFLCIGVGGSNDQAALTTQRMCLTANGLTLATPLAVAQGGTGAATAPANQFFAGSVSGASAAPAFRALANADFPPSAAGTMRGNPGSSAATPTDLTPAQIKVLLAYAASGANTDLSSVRLGVTPSVAGSSAAPGISIGQMGSSGAANFAAVAPGGAAGQPVGYDFFPTFATQDGIPRRAAQIQARFNGGSWGTETLDFLVGNNGASPAGNLDLPIFSLSGSGTASPNPLPVNQGGTGATTAAAARTSLGAAGSGSNSDITALTGLTTPLPLTEGGTGAINAGGARLNLGLDTMARQNAGAVAITGGAANGLTVLGLAKQAAAPTVAPGAGQAQLFVVAGTNSGTCKLQMIAGTSTTPVTIFDNVGSGC